MGILKVKTIWVNITPRWSRLLMGDSALLRCSIFHQNRNIFSNKGIMAKIGFWPVSNSKLKLRFSHGNPNRTEPVILKSGIDPTLQGCANCGKGYSYSITQIWFLTDT